MLSLAEFKPSAARIFVKPPPAANLRLSRIEFKPKLLLSRPEIFSKPTWGSSDMTYCSFVRVIKENACVDPGRSSLTTTAITLITFGRFGHITDLKTTETLPTRPQQWWFRIAVTLAPKQKS